MKIKIETWILKVMSKISGKKIIWDKYFRFYTDGGNPKIWHFSIHKMNYAKYWNMLGFVITILGRQFFFSFGKDINKLYEKD